jgi:multiple sugar transport system ATP-binding protein
MELPAKFVKALKGYEGKEIVFGIRPEDSLHDDEEVEKKFPSAVMNTTIKVAELLGHEYIIHTNLSGNNLISKIDALQTYRIGDKIKLVLNLDKAHVFDRETQATIL